MSEIDKIRLGLMDEEAIKNNAGLFREPALKLLSEIDRLRAELEQARRDYMELIMAVEKKFPDETRHQTALRYIKEREALCGDAKAEQELSE